MRAVCVAVAAMFAFAKCAFAQDMLPPIAPGPNEGPALPNGEDISRPLTPVELPKVPKPVEAEPLEKPEPVQRVESVQKQKYAPRGPLGPSWDDMEVLVWWTKAAPVPPLLTAARTGTPPVLGNPETLLLIGGQAISNQSIAGGRFTLGSALNEAETVGGEFVYFFLGSRTFKTRVNGVGNPRIPALGLPFVNANTGSEDFFPITFPGVSSGAVYITTTLRMQGAEANAVANLWDTKGLKVNGLLGYRFLQVHEGLTVEQSRSAGGMSGPIYDEFVGHNRFNGGQLGLHADVVRGMLFCELTGKVAIGQSFEMVRIDGATGVGGFTPGGVYTTPSNIGRFTRSAFAVVPEGTFKIGLKLTDAGRLYIGYNFLYLSDVVRPGDQLDRTLNPANIPVLNPGGGFVPPDRPRPLFTRSDFWAQGLTIGLETRY